MPLGIVAEVVAHGGFLPQLALLDQKKTFWNKKNGVIMAMFWFIILTPFQAALSGIIFGPTELQAFLAVLGVFGALLITLASLIFLPSSKPVFPFTQSSMPPPPTELYGRHQTALPPQQSVPASAYTPQPGNWRDTNDLQPTVSESATKLLEKDETPQ